MISLRLARRPARWFVVTVLMVTGALAGENAARAAAQPRVAVLDFQGTGSSKDTESLGVGLQSMLTTDLAQVSSITLVERARLRDVQKELKLSRSALADPATAVRLGKLAGASHLITGSHTELNKKMRLDARLVEVGTGKVVLASSAEGELDAFFELEKTLVGKLIEAIGVKLSVKERGAVARIHTTDFEAFRQFSSGVQLFDQEKYDESLVALRAALKKDDDFKLARTTLDTYERLAAELRGRAADIDAIEKTAAREKSQGHQTEERKLLDKLFEVTRASTGDHFKHAAATYMLACEHLKQISGATLFGLEDSFAEKRMTDALTQRYYPEALALFPRVPLVVHCLSDYGGTAPRSLAKFDTEFDEIAKRLDATSRQSITYARRTHEMARRLHLDLRGEADLTDKIYDLVMKLNPPEEWRLSMLDARATLRMALFDFDEAVRLQKQAADIAENFTQLAGSKADRLRRYAERIEEISALSNAMKRLNGKPYLREFVSRRLEPSHEVFAPSWTSPASIVKDMERDNLLERVSDFRRIRADDFVLLDRTPVWLARGMAVSAARVDGVRTAEIRYHSDKRPVETLLIFEGIPRKDLKASFELGFEPPQDFIPPHTFGPPEEINPSHATVTFLFSAKCIDCGRTPDPATGNWKYEKQPLEAWGLDIGPTEVRLVQVSMVERSGWKSPSPVTLTPKSAQPAAAAGNSVPVSIKLQGAQLTATIAGKTYTFAVPADRVPGFYGVLLRGPGFAALRKLEVGLR